ncbi:N-acetylglutamate kinase [Bacillus sp. OV322]|uniref:acetylglutamate kinase n=1 Tax=Bacillus sp. OV322 TaxID=1882764 RepID=UPI0008E03349|nr:acetylglutamate kinase [Bacillus sp. OV322]SFB97260.1 N-acetylglutamate kinase [Bacillus sp. OV322]
MAVLVLKCGGSIIDNLSGAFFESIKELQKDGYKIIFVHGGGPDINLMLEKSGIVPAFKNGLRVTTKEVFNIAELMLSGKSNRCLVHKLESCGIQTVGLNGSDAGILTGSPIDECSLGAVGNVEKVNTELLQLLFERGYCPVLTPISSDGSGGKLNVNADLAAGAVAKELRAETCIFVSDVPGVMKDGQIIEELNPEEAHALIQSGEVTGGMIPKVNTALAVLDNGIENVMIASGKIAFYKNGAFTGTKFLNEKRVLN